MPTLECGPRPCAFSSPPLVSHPGAARVRQSREADSERRVPWPSAAGANESARENRAVGFLSHPRVGPSGVPSPSRLVQATRCGGNAVTRAQSAAMAAGARYAIFPGTPQRPIMFLMFGRGRAISREKAGFPSPGLRTPAEPQPARIAAADRSADPSSAAAPCAAGRAPAPPGARQ